MQNEEIELFTPEIFCDEPAVPTPTEAVRAYVQPPPAPAKPVTAITDVTALKPITSITQLPSIWHLEATVEWLIDGFIPLGSVNLITSESGTGKTVVGNQRT